jgi:glutamyl-tRNA reductase
VIGSGEMGRLSAKGLLAEGCRVTITLRQYRSGEAVIPAGCRVVDYDERYTVLKDSKAVISATRSPHFTLSFDRVRELAGMDKIILIDLAVPRDIDPKISQLSNIELYDVDHLGGSLAVSGENGGIADIKTIIEEEIREFERWSAFGS